MIYVIIACVVCAVLLKAINAKDQKNRRFERYVRAIARAFNGAIERPYDLAQKNIKIPLHIHKVPFQIRFQILPQTHQLKLTAVTKNIQLPEWFACEIKDEQLSFVVQGQRWQGDVATGWACLFEVASTKERSKTSTTSESNDITDLILASPVSLEAQLQQVLFDDNAAWSLVLLEMSEDAVHWHLEYDWHDVHVQHLTTSCEAILNCLVESITHVVDNLPKSPWLFWSTLYHSQSGVNQTSLTALSWMVQSNFHRNDVQRLWGHAVDTAPVESLVQPALANPKKTLPVIVRADWKPAFYFDFLAKAASLPDVDPEIYKQVQTMCADNITADGYGVARLRHREIIIELATYRLNNYQEPHQQWHKQVVELTPQWLDWISDEDAVRWCHTLLTQYPELCTAEILAKTTHKTLSADLYHTLVTAVTPQLLDHPQKCQDAKWVGGVLPLLHYFPPHTLQSVIASIVQYASPQGFVAVRTFGTSFPTQELAADENYHRTRYALADLIEGLEARFAVGGLGNLTLSEDPQHGALSVSSSMSSGQLTQTDQDH